MNQLSAGTAQESIRISESVPLSGYRSSRVSDGVHDPLEATAVVISDGTMTVGIVSVDVLNVSYGFHARVADQLNRRNLHFDSLLVAATHSHSGPYIPAPSIDVDPFLSVEEPSLSAVNRVENACVRSVVHAFEAREPAVIRWGRANNETTPVNRRATGGVDNAVRVPHGPVDPELLVLEIETSSGKITDVVNFACHPICCIPSTTLLSRDWPGYVSDRFEDAEHTILYLNGAGADVNPRDRQSIRYDDSSEKAVYQYAEQIGQEIADTVSQAISDARRNDAIERGNLHLQSCEFSFPVKSVPDPTSVETRLQEIESLIASTDIPQESELACLRADQMYLKMMSAIDDWGCEQLSGIIQFIQFGEIGIISVPGELFAAKGLQFKETAAVEQLMIAGYANGYLGYLPPVTQLENGGYEVLTAKVSPTGTRRLEEMLLDWVK